MNIFLVFESPVHHRKVVRDVTRRLRCNTRRTGMQHQIQHTSHAHATHSATNLCACSNRLPMFESRHMRAKLYADATFMLHDNCTFQVMNGMRMHFSVRGANVYVVDSDTYGISSGLAQLASGVHWPCADTLAKRMQRPGMRRGTKRSLDDKDAIKERSS